MFKLTLLNALEFIINNLDAHINYLRDKKDLTRLPEIKYFEEIKDELAFMLEIRDFKNGKFARKTD